MDICTNDSEKIEEEEEEEEEEGDICSGTSSDGTNSRAYARKDSFPLNLLCDWKDCTAEEYTDYNEFMTHVSLHIPEVHIKTTVLGEVYECNWNNCNHESTDNNEIIRHILFHGLHTKLKDLGAKYVKKFNLPKCNVGNESRNYVQDLPNPFTCEWEDCNDIFNNPEKFYTHVAIHAFRCRKDALLSDPGEGRISCKWKGCNATTSGLNKLNDHVKTHTKRKGVACPSCGNLFVTNTKFYDHCKRQLPSEMHGYQCSHCSKYYPSGRILRNHMRHHVNQYKCRFCDMTCPSPSVLSLHIRYRHINSRPFKCEFCNFSAKTKLDLKFHIATHCEDPMYECEIQECNFRCRSVYGLNQHIRKVHELEEEKLYCCHLCERRFQRGSHLTVHLCKHHNLNWPSGHCRFRYKYDDDGLYRLQTVRYESLELTEELMKGEESAPPEDLKVEYKIQNVTSEGGTYAAELVLSDKQDEDENNVDDVEKPSDSILITLEEVDSTGKVISKKYLNSKESSGEVSSSMIILEDGLHFD